MRRTPWGIRYAERTDLQNGPDLAQAMGEDIEGLFNSEYVDLSAIRTDAEITAIHHSFDGYTQWPRGPQVRGTSSGSSNLATSGSAFVSDRVRHLGTWVLADLIVAFALGPSLTGDLELQLPYQAFSSDGLVGSFVFTRTDGVTQSGNCELFSDQDWTRFTLAVDGLTIDNASLYMGHTAQMYVQLKYEAVDFLESI